MKYFAFFSIGLVLVACGGNEQDKETTEFETTFEDVVTDALKQPEIVDTISKPGETIEYYPNGAIKMRGKLNEEGNRQGLWVSYYDNGTKWSESYYDNGIVDGHSITFFPNGKVRYIGEYKQGEKSGVWKFYDESGEFVKEENF